MPPKRRAEGGCVERGGRGSDQNDEGYFDEASGLVFEDPFGDDFEEEEVIDDESCVNEDGEGSEADMDMDEENVQQVWRPGVDQLQEGEVLEHDPSAYVMYHSMRMEWPCLSFDVLRDAYGEGRHRVSGRVLNDHDTSCTYSCCSSRCPCF
jgi:hypothetical protein